MAYQMGIDLGTTFSSVAVTRDRTVEVLSLGTRSAVIPSVVLVLADGTVLVGEAAETRAAFEPSRVAREFKRRLGDPTPLFLGGVPYSAEALTSILLRFVYDRAVERMGSEPSAVVITHPATYSSYKLDALRDAIKQAGIERVTLAPEPTAAAVDYASTAAVGDGDVIGVYDFGGGTFDAALVRRNGAGFAVLGEAQGVERLGGIDFDLAILEHVRHQLPDGLALESTDPVTLGAVARLRADCRAAKEQLSGATEANIPVLLPGHTAMVPITRVEFEQMIAPRLNAPLAALERAAASAELTLADVNRVVLVGGSSRIPIVRQQLQRALGREVHVDTDPEATIARGAARLAAASVPLAPPVGAFAAAAAPTAVRSSRWKLPVAAAVIAVVALVGSLLAFGGDDSDKKATTTTRPPAATQPAGITATTSTATTTPRPSTTAAASTTSSSSSSTSTSTSTSSTTSTSTTVAPTTTAPAGITVSAVAPTSPLPNQCGSRVAVAAIDPLPPATTTLLDTDGCVSYTGSISAAGERDEFVLQLTAGEHIAMSGDVCANVDVTGPSTSQVVAAFTGCNGFAKSFRATDGDGVYHLHIQRSDDSLTNYSIQFIDVTTPLTVAPSAFVATTCPRQFLAPGIVPVEAATATIGTDNCPSWTGSITAASQTDEFVLDLKAGQRIALAGDVCATMDVTGPSTSQVVPGFTGCNGFAKSFRATDGDGPYILHIQRTDDSTTKWSISFVDVTTPTAAAPRAFVATTCTQLFIIPSTVPSESTTPVIGTNNCPSWSGSIASAGEVDEFVLDLKAFQRVALSGDVCANIDVIGPTTSQIGPTFTGCNGFTKSFQATDGEGKYVIRISKSDDSGAKYSIGFTSV